MSDAIAQLFDDVRSKLQELERNLQRELHAREVAAERRVLAAEHTDELLTAEQVAALSGLSLQGVYRRAGRWPFTVRVGRLLRFSRKGFEAWATSH